jgi:hypothetical protein
MGRLLDEKRIKSIIFVPMKKPLIGYEALYEITSSGKIYSIRGKKYLKPHLHHSGYYTYGITVNNKAKYFIRSRLVAIHFIPNPLGLKEVNHKNGIKTDDRIRNLEWVTPSQNIIHYYEVLGKGCRRKVNQLSMDGKFIKRWPSLASAARSVNGSNGNIHSTCQGKFAYAYGYKWSFS